MPKLGVSGAITRKCSASNGASRSYIAELEAVWCSRSSGFPDPVSR